MVGSVQARPGLGGGLEAAVTAASKDGRPAVGAA